MKKIAWNALITLLFTLAAIQCARALAEEPPAFAQDLRKEPLRILIRNGEEDAAEPREDVLLECSPEEACLHALDRTLLSRSFSFPGRIHSRFPPPGFKTETISRRT